MTDSTISVASITANSAYTLHHTASRRGYVSRKSAGRVEQYSGRYGVGYIIVRPRRDTTQYVYIDYYIHN